MNLTEFLLARIAEDEAKVVMMANELDRFAAAPINRGSRMEWLAGIEVFVSPSRLMTECQAKRQIVALHAEDAPFCGWSHDPNCEHSDFPYPCPTLAALLLPYSEHPDFNQEWKL